MDRKAREFLKIAYELLRKNCRGLPKEGCYRTIVNRLYYGTLHLVAKGLEKAGEFKPARETPKIHSIVIGRLKRICPDVGNHLEKLHELRKKADYDLHLPFEKSDLKTAKVLAELIQEEVNKCLSNYRWRMRKKN
jgi:uncharacterized protein (UPF0332 family)